MDLIRNLVSKILEILEWNVSLKCPAGGDLFILPHSTRSVPIKKQPFY